MTCEREDTKEMYEGALEPALDMQIFSQSTGLPKPLTGAESAAIEVKRVGEEDLLIDESALIYDVSNAIIRYLITPEDQTLLTPGTYVIRYMVVWAGSRPEYFGPYYLVIKEF